MSPIKTEIVDKCSIKINWTPPEDGGLAISKYKIEVCSKEGCNSIIGDGC
jgi:hypothetical protein